MEVNVKINKLIDKNGLKAMATIGLDNMLSIPNIRIMEGEYVSLYFLWPSTS